MWPGQLQAMGAAQGVARLVALSIVGLERVPGFGYYEAKLAQESALWRDRCRSVSSGRPSSTSFPCRSSLVPALGPLALVPVMRIQPVAARAVGEALLGIASEPTETTVEIAGPEEKNLVALARAIVRKRALSNRGGGSAPAPGPRRKGHAHRAASSHRRRRASSARPSRSGWTGEISPPWVRESGAAAAPGIRFRSGAEKTEGSAQHGRGGASMASHMERLEQIVARLPEATRVDIEAWGGEPTFRVRGKLRVRQSRRHQHQREAPQGGGRSGGGHRPHVAPTGYGLGRHGWVSVTLGARLGRARWGEVEEWIRTSYTLVAPKGLARQVLDEDTNRR